MLRNCLFFLLTLVSFTSYAQRVFSPNASGSLSGAATYCQGASPSNIVFNYTTCSIGSGASSGTPITVEWYVNSVNATTGGTLVSSTVGTSAITTTGNVSYTPPTTTEGIYYYYCKITWDTTGSCNTTGSITSSATARVKVTFAASAITGNSNMCTGVTATFTNTVTAGTWTSSSTAVAAVNSTSGLVNPLSSGTTTISYTTGCGTPATFPVTVSTSPAALTGTTSVCQNATTTFSSTTAGGTWSSSNTSVASVDGAGVISGINPGTSTIIYTTGSCSVSRVVTVATTPVAIAGSSSVCTGSTTTLTNATPGGAWSRTNGTGTCSIGSTTGIVTGGTAGLATISYTIGSCRAIAPITINQTPAALTGTNTVCEGSTTTFASTTTGGTWSSSNTSVATVDASGVIYGTLAGTATITYLLGSCFVTRALTVNNTPDDIIGALTVCTGATTTLSSSTTGGTWGRTNGTGTLSIGASTGIVTGATAGNATISYTLGSCRITQEFTINQSPAAITGGVTTLCKYANTTFTSTTAGGTWSSSNSSVATINSSTGVIGGVNSGTAVITYSNDLCFVTRSMTVNLAPEPISGTTNICNGTSTTLSSTPSGGTWTSSVPARATITVDGVVTALAAGTSNISYTIGSCRAITVFTVTAQPNAIGGTPTVCENGTRTLTNSVSGGVWSSNNTSIATVNPTTGLVTGLVAGSTTITYSIGSCFSTLNITVEPALPAITGASATCTGTSVTLSNSSTGGTWTRTNGTGNIGIGSTTGIVTAFVAGTATVSYTISACVTTYPFTANQSPAGLTGTTTVCEGATTTYANSVAGGTWSSSNNTIATVDGSGVVYGVNSGSATITYAIGPCFVTRAVTVNNSPGITSGPSSVCTGSNITLSNPEPGGTWASSSTAVATVTGTTGIVRGVTQGQITISYSIGACRAFYSITVKTVPTEISGSNNICEGTVAAYSNSSLYGTWSSSNPAVASIEPTTGNAFGVSNGSAVITYTTGCGADTTKTVSVTNSPDAIVGADSICNGLTTTYTNPSTGGVWSSSNTSVASINASSGVITAVAPGTITIFYNIGTCFATKLLTVKSLPTAGSIDGTNNLCLGLVAELGATAPFGVWSSSNESVATISETARATGLAVGTTTISYTVSNTCGTAISTHILNVREVPTIIAGSIPPATFGSTSVTMTFTTTGTPTNYSLTWNSTALSAGFTSISTSLGSSPLSISLPSSGVFGTFSGNISVSNAYCTSNSTPISVSILTGKNIYTFAGNGTSGYSGDNGVATSAEIANPSQIATDRNGNTYIADYTNAVVRKIDRYGIISTFAGNGVIGFSGDGGSALSAQLSHPSGIAVDSSNNVYISDFNNHVVRKVDAITGIITTVAGNGAHSYTGDGGPATSASLFYPMGLSFDNENNLHITDYLHSVIRKVDASGIISTVAGNGTTAYTGDGSGATSASLNYPRSICFDRSGNMYIADYDNNVVRKVNTSGIISTYAGTGTSGYSGDGGAAISANMNHPFGVAADSIGNVYVSELHNHIVRKITTTGTINTIAGSGTSGYTGDGGDAISATLYQPMFVHVDRANNILVADNANNAVRIIGNLRRAPKFNNGDATTLTVCENSSINAINSLLSVTDFDNGETLSWSIYSTPSHGSVTASYTTTSTGGSITPTGLSYTPTTSYSGLDTFKIQVTDGYSTSTIDICVTINPLPVVGSISGALSVCSGASTTYTDTTAGGTWSSSNTAIATINNTTGILTALSAGITTLSYSVTNSCGTTIVSYPISIVSPTSGAIGSVSNTCIGHNATITLTGTPGATAYYNLASGATDSTTLIGGSATVSVGPISDITTFYLSATGNGTCSVASTDSAVINPQYTTWVGGASGNESNWNTGTNWSCGNVPTASDYVLIPSGTVYSPSVSASTTQSVYNLTVSSGAAVVINSGATLITNGALSHSGTINGAGVLKLNGSSAQSISGNGTIEKLELDNSAGASIQAGANIGIRNTLTITSGNLNANDAITLLSDATSTARVAPISSGSISGTVKVQQYIPGGRRAYRFFSHPYNSWMSLSQFQDDIDITGTGGSLNGFTTTGSNAASAFRYNPMVGNSALSSDPGWRPITSLISSADSNRMQRYQGMRIFVRGTKGQGLDGATYVPSPVTITTSGVLNQGRQTIYMQKGTGANQDYNLLGNPYASPVDIGTIAYNAKVSGNMAGAAIYVWNPYMSTTGIFQAIPVNTTSPTPYILQANGAFEIRTSNNGDSLVFNESNKANAPTTSLLRSIPEYTTLYIYDMENRPWDMTYIRLGKEFNAAEEQDADAKKLDNPELSFYSISSDDKKLTIDNRDYTDETVIPLGINSKIAAAFQIKAEQVVIPNGYELYLKDNLLNKQVILNSATSYPFSVTENKGTQGNNRFALVLRKATEQQNKQPFAVSLFPNPTSGDVVIKYTNSASASITVKVVDVKGSVLFTQDVAASGNGKLALNTDNFASGTYFIEIKDGDTIVTEKLIKE